MVSCQSRDFNGSSRLHTHIPAAGSYPRPTTRSAKFSPPGIPMSGTNRSGTAPRKLCVMLRGARMFCVAKSLQFESVPVMPL